MPKTAVFLSRRSAALICTFGLAAATAACSGIAPETVRDSTAAITAQVALAKASVVACRGGDREQCDTAQANLEAIASENARLNALAE